MFSGEGRRVGVAVTGSSAIPEYKRSGGGRGKEFRKHHYELHIASPFMFFEIMGQSGHLRGSVG